MKPHVVNFLTRLALLVALVPQLVFAGGMFTPRIQNHGTYKPTTVLSTAQLEPLFGHVPVEVNTSTKLAPMDRDNVLSLSIMLPLNNEAELELGLMEVTNPKSPYYGHFLSHEEFVNRYAPTTSQVSAVESHLKAHGMRIDYIDANRLIIHATGRVETINTVFNTEIWHFADHNGERFYAPVYELQVDKSIQIHSVHGLENRFHAKPHYKLLNTSEQSTQMGPAQGLTPADIKSAYSLSSTLDGTGQVLALLELDGFTQADITAYESAFNLPNVPVVTVLVDNATGVPGEGAAEVTLDIELMIALAPGVSQIIVYEGPNSSQGIIDTYNKIATDQFRLHPSALLGEPSEFLEHRFLH